MRRDKTYSKILQVCEYLVENKISLKATSRHFKVTTPTIYRYVEELKSINYELYLEARKIIETYKTYNRSLEEEFKVISRQIEICQYIADNKVTISEAALHFESNYGFIYSSIGKVYNYNPDLYYDVRKVINSNKGRGGRRKVVLS